MFREDLQPQPLEMNGFLNQGGLGDQIGRLPAIRYLALNYPFVKMSLWVPDFLFDIAVHLMKPFEKVIVYRYTDRALFQPMPSCDFEGGHTTLRTHITDHAFHTFLDMASPSIQHKNYLKFRADEVPMKFELPERYAVITTLFTAPARSLMPKTINEISRHLNSLGVSPVFLGKQEVLDGIGHQIKVHSIEGIDLSLGIDLLNKTSLIDAAKIMSGAEFVLGLDNGLIHLAATTDVPIIVAYTTVDPKLRLPIRNDILGSRCIAITPSAKLQCRFCQSNMNFIYTHDFTECLYKDYECVKGLSGRPFIQAIDVMLGVNKPS